MTKYRLSVIVPVFNEESTVIQLIRKILKVKLPKNIVLEVVVVNDGSTDNTPLLLASFHSRLVRVYHHRKNKGKGAAVRTGFQRATGEIFIIQDADLEYDPNDFPRLLQPIFSDKVNIVYGTRLKNYPLNLWGEDKTPLPTHWIGNKLLTLVTNLLYGAELTDMETCYKMFKSDVILGLNLKSNRFEIEPEITAKLLKKGHRIHEIPIKVKPRTHQQGKKIHWYDGVGAVWTLFRYRFSD